MDLHNLCTVFNLVNCKEDAEMQKQLAENKLKNYSFGNVVERSNGSFFKI
jgi:hypothetical protein